MAVAPVRKGADMRIALRRRRHQAGTPPYRKSDSGRIVVARRRIVAARDRRFSSARRAL